MLMKTKDIKRANLFTCQCEYCGKFFKPEQIIEGFCFDCYREINKYNPINNYSCEYVGERGNFNLDN